MGLFDSLKQVTDSVWALEQSASAARQHRCFLNLFNVQDAYESYKEKCGPLVEEVVKAGTYFRTKCYAYSCFDSGVMSEESLNKWFEFTPTLIPFIKRESMPVLFITDVIRLSDKTYTWDTNAIDGIKKIISKYQKSRIIYCDDTIPAYHIMLEELGFQRFNVGGVTYWRLRTK